MKASAYAWMTPPVARRDEWDESQHPRAEDGKFLSDNDVPGDDIHLNEKSLGIPREAMPQIKSAHLPEFLADLRKRGIGVKAGETAVGELKPTQSEINIGAVRTMLASLPEETLKRSIIVSSDGYVLDGHHRWAALKLKDPKSKIQTHTVDLPIRELLDVANKFPNVARRGIHTRRDSVSEIIERVRQRGVR